MKKIISFLVTFIVACLIYSLSTWYMGTFDIATCLVTSLIITLFFTIFESKKS